MKRLLFALPVLAVMALNLTCGGGGGTSSSGTGQTPVTISIGAGGAPAGVQAEAVTPAAVPGNVAVVQFTVSGAGFDPIRRSVLTGRSTTIVESFLVPNGANIHFLVDALDNAAPANVLFRGETFATLDGRPVSLSIVMGPALDLFVDNVVNDPSSGNLTFDVGNGGAGTAGNVSVFVVNSNFCFTGCQPITVTVPPGGSVPVFLGELGALEYKIFVDPGNAVAESNEANNTACLGALCSDNPPTSCP